MSKPFVLVTNDDGINAPGIKAITKELLASGKFEVQVVAPAIEQSAKSHSISIHGAIEVEKHIFEEEELKNVVAYKVHGSPVDCVKLGMASLLVREGYPDLIVSGINRGNNCGLNVLPSGTVAAAMAARVRGLNAVALSLDHPTTYVSGEPHNYDRWNFSAAAKRAMPAIDEVLLYGAPDGVVLNINFPNVATEDEILGYKRTRQGWSGWKDKYAQLPNNGDRMVFRIQGEVDCADKEEAFDMCAIRNGWIAVTPLGIHHDPTHIDDYKKVFDDLADWELFKNNKK